MKQPSAAVRDLAAQILAQEACMEPLLSESAAMSAFERLRLHLSKFIGVAGYHALLARALALAVLEEPSLGCIRLQSPGSLDVLESCATDETDAWGQVLLAQLIDLLVIFVGEALTARLVQDVWPEVTLQLSLNFQIVAVGERK